MDCIMPNNQLQAYLEQLYRANAMNASPELRTPMLHDANLAAQYDAGNYQAPRPPVQYQNPYENYRQPLQAPNNLQAATARALARQQQAIRPNTLAGHLMSPVKSKMSRKVPRPITPSLPHTL
jgi:hypothetical protein